MELGFNPLICALAFALDIAIGDPFYRYHPVVIFGKIINLCEKVLRALKLSGVFGGLLLWVIVNALGLGICLVLVWLLGLIDPLVAIIGHGLLVYSLLALGDLNKHGRKVLAYVKSDNLPKAREWIGRLVGRDTDKMSGSDCLRASIESLSENFCDGVIAPLFWYALFGLPGLVIFKISSTLDSMVAYRNERYEKFGKVSARLDDLLCFVPARLTVCLYVLASLFVPKLRVMRGLIAIKRLAKRYPGFNSGWPESMAGGLLGIKLVGPIFKQGILVQSDFVGLENDREIAEPSDLKKLIVLNYLAAILFVTILVLLAFLMK